MYKRDCWMMGLFFGDGEEVDDFSGEMFLSMDLLLGLESYSIRRNASSIE